MSKRNPFISMAMAHGAWKHINNGTRQAEQAQRLADLQEDHLLELERQTELQEEYNNISREGIHLQRQKNQIENMKLHALEKDNQLSEIRNKINENAYNLSLVQDKRQELRINVEKNHKDIELRRRDCIFNIKKDIERLEQSCSERVEQVIQIINHIASINDFGITTELSSSFNDKELIHSTNEKLNSMLENINSELTEEETNDLFMIHKVVQIDEEKIIFNAEFDINKINKAIRNYEQDLNSLRKKEDGLISNFKFLEHEHQKHILKKHD